MVNPVVESLPKGSIASTEKTLIHVLHVDDDAGYLKTAKKILEMQGSFHVGTASSVEEAMEKMEEKTFDVIVSDYIMPGKDGLEFLKELRDSGNSIPFIIFTGKGREIVAIKALNLGANQYINKIGKPEAVYSELAHGIVTVVKGKKAEEALRENEKEKSAVLDSMSELVVHQDLEHRVLWANRQATISVGISAEQFQGSYCHEIWANSASPCTGCPVEETIKTGQPQQGEITTPDGRVWFISGYPIKDANGNVTSVVEVATEITEQKKAEEALRKSEKEWSDSFNALEDVMVIIDKDFTIEKMNDSGLKLLGKTREEVTGKKCYQTIHGLDASCEFCPYERTLKTGKLESVDRYEEVFGKYFSIKSSPIFNERGEPLGFVDLMRDITEQKRGVETLRESEEKYRELLNGMNDTAWVIDFDGKFVDVNNAAVRVMGYSREELLSMGPTDIDSSLHPEEIKALVKGMPADEVQVFETVHTTKDGNNIPVEISSSLVTYKGKQVILSIARDITERKEAEKKLDEMMNELVAINEKLGVVGKLTRHDARNKLSVMANNVYLAKQKLAANHNSLEYLGEIESAIDQMEKIFDFARTYEMLGVEALSYVDVEKSVKEAAMLFSGMNGIKLVNECQGYSVMADSLLRQLFYNLIDDTMKHGEKVSQIRVYYEEDEDQLKLVYEDDGIGIPEDEKEKIFGEGYGKGTGYGLYLIKKICETYGWTIRETGKLGKGAQFTMTIPKTNLKGKIAYQLH